MRVHQMCLGAENSGEEKKHSHKEAVYGLPFKLSHEEMEEICEAEHSSRHLIKPAGQ